MRILTKADLVKSSYHQFQSNCFASLYILMLFSTIKTIGLRSLIKLPFFGIFDRLVFNACQKQIVRFRMWEFQFLIS